PTWAHHTYPHEPTVDIQASQVLYTPNAIQTGVTPNAINRRQAAVVQGMVRTRDGQVLSDVRVTVLGTPSFGQTRTRADGRFDMAVNGGAPLTLHYEKSGYISADRLVNAPWNDFVSADDAVMIPFDTAVTTVDLR